MKQTFAKEGLGGFYKGIGSPLVGVTGVNAVCFYAFNQSLQFYYNYVNTESSEEEDKLRKNFTPTPYIFAGALTGVALSFIEGPVELVKAKLQVQYGDVKQYNGTLDCAGKIAKQHGIRGIFQGYAPTLARNVPANIAYFGFYEWLKKSLSQNSDVGTISPAKTMLAGGTAGAFYWISCFPVDVIKSRMQVDSSDPAKRQYRNMLHCAQLLYAQHGFKAFYWGFAPCLMRAFPANGACFFVYELTKKFLSNITVD
jgi:solute carrier family 25 carnitine/acylcarnitine transporter 20/29